MPLIVSLVALSLTLAPAIAKDPTPAQNMFCGIVYEEFAKTQTDPRLEQRFSYTSMAIMLIESDSPNYDRREAKARADFAKAREAGGADNLPKLRADCEKLGFEK